jgi:hypothetical protein
MQLRFASFAVINLREDLHLQECAHAGRTMKKKSPHQRALGLKENLDQPKFFSANDQFTKLLRKVSTNLGRMLR